MLPTFGYVNTPLPLLAPANNDAACSAGGINCGVSFHSSGYMPGIYILQ